MEKRKLIYKYNYSWNNDLCVYAHETDGLYKTKLSAWKHLKKTLLKRADILRCELEDIENSIEEVDKEIDKERNKLKSEG